MSVYTVALNEQTASSSRRRVVDAGSAGPTPKLERACDFCRRRKTKCDGGRTQGDRCTNCIRNKISCTYLEPSKPRGPPKSYVNSLEDRIDRFEQLLKRLRPDADFSDEVGPPVVRDSWRRDGRSVYSNSQNEAGPSQPKHSISKPMHNPFSPPFYNHSNHSISGTDNESVFSTDEEEEVPQENLKRLTKYPTFPDSSDYSNLAYESDLSMRFHGKSSFFPLLRVTRDFKRKNSPYDDDSPSPQNSEKSAENIRGDQAPSSRREFYWKLPPWERAWEQSSSMQPFCTPLCPSGPPSQSESARKQRCHTFPPQDLTLSLIALYFTHLNSQFPLLHQPLFYDQFNSNLHLQDTRFAATVWCVLANASRWSDDPRVLWTGWGADESAANEKFDVHRLWLSAGWRFFARGMDAFHHTQSIITPPHLFDVQSCSLAAMFLRCSTYPANAWVMNGIGIRKAQDIGAHRKKVYKSKPNIDDELWKRAFWMLVSFDRIDSALNGRPCCIPEEDFDLDLPLDVDDEYWVPVDPALPTFVQPEGKPSYMSFFIHFCKLMQIFAYATRTIYCIEKSTAVLNIVGSRWKEKVVAQLNTALGEWVDAIPKHLRWASKIDSEVFSNQSAVLYTCYYLCVILIYAPFISPTSAPMGDQQQQQPTSDKRSPSTNSPFPALAICVNAAHSAVRTFEAQLRRGLSNIPNMLHAAQICTPILLLGYWDAKAKLNEEDPNDPDYSTSRLRAYERILGDIRKCINALEISEARWGMARTVLKMLRDALPESGTHPEARSETRMENGPRNSWEEQRHPTSFDRSSAQRTFQPTEVVSPIHFDRDAYVLHESLPVRGHSRQFMQDSPYAQMSSYVQMSPNKSQAYPLHVSTGTLNYHQDESQKSHSSGSAGSITPELSNAHLQMVHLSPYLGSEQDQQSRPVLPVSHTRRSPSVNDILPPPSQILSDANIWRRSDESSFSGLGQRPISFTSDSRTTEDMSFQINRLDEKRAFLNQHRFGQMATQRLITPHYFDANPPASR